MYNVCVHVPTLTNKLGSSPDSLSLLISNLCTQERCTVHGRLKCEGEREVDHVRSPSGHGLQWISLCAHTFHCNPHASLPCKFEKRRESLRTRLPINLHVCIQAFSAFAVYTRKQKRCGQLLESTCSSQPHTCYMVVVHVSWLLSIPGK